MNGALIVVVVIVGLLAMAYMGYGAGVSRERRRWMNAMDAGLKFAESLDDKKTALKAYQSTAAKATVNVVLESYAGTT
jgi:Tfp pilus assembly protein PilE